MSDQSTGQSQPPAKTARPWFKKKRYVIPIGLVVIGAFASVGGESDDSANKDKVEAVSSKTAGDSTKSTEKAEPAAKPEKKAEKKPAKKKVVKVSAKRIIKDFEQNELAADDKYKGKQIQVTGTVDKIDTEFWDDDKYILRISDGSDFAVWTVNCSDMSKKELSTLSVGADVTVVGGFKDGGDLGVELKKCKLV